MGTIQITTTVDEAMYAEVKRRGYKFSELVDLGYNLQVKGQSIESDNINLRDANQHLRYALSDKDSVIAALNSQIEQLQKGKWPTTEEANGTN